MSFSEFVDAANGIIWSPALVFLCLGAGVFFTVMTRCSQVRHLPHMFQCLFGGKASAKGVSSFQAFALAVSGRVGVGNIAGVAAAIGTGGPGAIFWMWLIAFVGSGSAYVEAALAQIFKGEADGQYRGGPAYYIERGMKSKWYAATFALATIIGCGLCLPTVQSNQIGKAMTNAFGIDPRICGGLLVILVGLIIIGGVKRISRAAQLIVPIMAVGYVITALVVIVANISEVPAAFGLIFSSAFGIEATFGGILGSAIMMGVKRGIYSNEAGQGTAPMAAAAAEVEHPARQGLVQSFSIYFDTWLVCSATALMILTTGSYNTTGEADGAFLYEGLPGVESGPAFTQAAVDTLAPGFGSGFVAIALLFFAFTTILAYYYYTENNIAYLMPGDSKIRSLIFKITQVVFLGVIFFGTINDAKLVWSLGDIGVGLMAWVNIIAILILTKPAIRCLRDYEKKLKSGETMSFKGEDIGLSEDSTEAWK
ncbi:MAG: alanine/glycine:cation symporter family protein [Verrucomicrobiota bacterium]